MLPFELLQQTRKVCASIQALITILSSVKISSLDKDPQK